jgi:hypothetical protein
MKLSIIWITFFSISVFFSTLNAYAQSGKLPGLKGTVSYIEEQLKALPCKTNIDNKFHTNEITGFKLTDKNKIKITEKVFTIDQSNGDSVVTENHKKHKVFPRIPKFSYVLTKDTYKNGDKVLYPNEYGCYNWSISCEGGIKCVEQTIYMGKSAFIKKEGESLFLLTSGEGFYLGGKATDQERVRRAFEHLLSLMKKKEEQQEAADPFAAPTSEKKPNPPIVIDEPADSNVIILD